MDNLISLSSSSHYTELVIHSRDYFLNGYRMEVFFYSCSDGPTDIQLKYLILLCIKERVSEYWVARELHPPEYRVLQVDNPESL